MEDKLKEYEQLKSQLKGALDERKQYEDELNKLRQEIYDKETEYFSNVTADGSPKGSSNLSGNIIKGFEGFSKSSHHQNMHGTNINDPLNIGLPNKDRIFSLSDADFVKQLQHEGLLPGFEESTPSTKEDEQ